MIRRFYVLPLDRGVSDLKADELLTALTESDRFISGLTDSFAGIDVDSRTIVWEMTFRDEETYAGPYMVHPYHVATIDSYLLGDSPERLSHDFAAMRYRIPDGTPHLKEGIRRVLLMNLADGADTSILEALADRSEGTATSVFSSDDIAWRSSKGLRGLTWTHVWEQGFVDLAALNEYLTTPDGVACSNRDGLRRLGADVQSLLVLTYPFSLTAAPRDPDVPTDDQPFLYTITARTSVQDAEPYIRLLEQEYDVALAEVGAKLQSRWRTLDDAYLEAEVQSTWQFDSMVSFKDFRSAMTTDPSWNRFVLNAMPLVRSGTRRFYRAV